MITSILAAAPAAAAGENPYGLMEALEQGGAIAWATFLILAGMSVVSFYILFTKLFEQQKIINQAKRVRAGFWTFGQPARRRGEAREATRPIARSSTTAWPRRSSTPS